MFVHCNSGDGRTDSKPLQLMIRIVFAATIMRASPLQFSRKLCFSPVHNQVLCVRAVPIPDAVFLKSSCNIPLSGFLDFSE